MLRLNTNVMPGSLSVPMTPRGPAATTASGARPRTPVAASDSRKVALGGTLGATVCRQLTRPAATGSVQRTRRGTGFFIETAGYQFNRVTESPRKAGKNVGLGQFNNCRHQGMRLRIFAKLR